MIEPKIKKGIVEFKMNLELQKKKNCEIEFGGLARTRARVAIIILFCVCGGGLMSAFFGCASLNKN
jgi:hypothetical protein